MRVEGLLIDLDGTLYTNDGPIEGARGALERLDRAGIPYRFVTNATHRPRRELAAHLETLGFPAAEGRIFTPAIAVSEKLRAEGLSCFPLVEDALLEDLEGVKITDDSPGCVLVGNLGAGFTYRLLDTAFRHLRAGARLIALSKNRYWQRAGGELALDAGPFVAALEYASGKSAIGVGKPERAFFELALRNLGLPPGTVAVVGDEPELDIGGAQAAGLHGILVETGRYRPGAELPTRPDLILASVARLPEALGI
ncbi:TIGR01458 family HAD-type hydrolase [Rubrobacter tropicus]|uniref:TIGR01458 family HAD-type hydrolase n=1 Tax=Rubrobacter tropicus TaxID=2653851 RepID=UPI00140AEEB1|nr:TIGR01458 family HAD-type hydrolase [Rubrobacter tropicus]